MRADAFKGKSYEELKAMAQEVADFVNYDKEAYALIEKTKTARLKVINDTYSHAFADRISGSIILRSGDFKIVYYSKDWYSGVPVRTFYESVSDHITSDRVVSPASFKKFSENLTKMLTRLIANFVVNHTENTIEELDTHYKVGSFTALKKLVRDAENMVGMFDETEYLNALKTIKEAEEESYRISHELEEYHKASYLCSAFMTALSDAYAEEHSRDVGQRVWVGTKKEPKTIQATDGDWIFFTDGSKAKRSSCDWSTLYYYNHKEEFDMYRRMTTFKWD